MKFSLYLFCLASILFSCVPQKEDNKHPKLEEFYDWSNFKFEVSKSLIKIDSSHNSFYFPQYEDSSYYMVDLNGEKVSKTKFSTIIINPTHPFYWGKINESYYLYTYPERRVIQDAFDQIYDINISGSDRYIDSANKNNLSLYKISVAGTTNSHLDHYFFTIKSEDMVKSRYTDLLPKCEGRKKMKVERGIGNKSYHILFYDRLCGYYILDNNFKVIVDEKFSDLRANFESDRFIIVKKGDREGIVDVKKRLFTGYKYSRVNVIFGDPFIYTVSNSNEPDSNINFHNGNGEIFISLPRDKIKGIYYGIISYKYGNKRRYYDLVEKKEIEIPEKAKVEGIKGMTREKGRVLFISKEGNFISKENEVIITKSNKELSKTEVLRDKIRKSYQEDDLIKLSRSYGEQGYRFLSINNNLHTIVDSSGNPYFPADSLIITSNKVHSAGYGNIAILKNKHTDYLLLDHNLNLINFPKRLDVEKTNMMNLVTTENKDLIKYRRLRFPIQGFYFYYSDKNEITHVFRTNGDYVSTHSGLIKTIVTPYKMTGYSAKDKLYEPFAEVAHPKGHKYQIDNYYIRLTDGFEYHKNDSNKNDE